MKKLCALIVTLCLAGCATGVPAEKKAGIRSLGIISAIGDPITFKTVGIMVFTNDEKKEAVPEWRLDEFVTAKIADSLRARYAVMPVNFRREAFLPERLGLFDSGRKVGDIVRSDVTTKGLDAYVVVQQYKNGDIVVNSNQTLEGLGLYRRWTIIGPYHYAYAGYIITVVDGRSFEAIGTAITRVPADQVEDSLWAPTLGEMSAQQKQRLREALTKVLEKDLPEKLEKLNL